MLVGLVLTPILSSCWIIILRLFVYSSFWFLNFYILDAMIKFGIYFIYLIKLLLSTNNRNDIGYLCNVWSISNTTFPVSRFKANTLQLFCVMFEYVNWIFRNICYVCGFWQLFNHYTLWAAIFSTMIYLRLPENGMKFQRRYISMIYFLSNWGINKYQG